MRACVRAGILGACVRACVRAGILGACVRACGHFRCMCVRAGILGACVRAGILGACVHACGHFRCVGNDRKLRTFFFLRKCHNLNFLFCKILPKLFITYNHNICSCEKDDIQGLIIIIKATNSFRFCYHFS